MTTSPDAPATGGAPPGSAALLTRLVCDDAVAAIAFYGRSRDPAGHLWLLSAPLGGDA